MLEENVAREGRGAPRDAAICEACSAVMDVLEGGGGGMLRVVYIHGSQDPGWGDPPREGTHRTAGGISPREYLPFLDRSRELPQSSKWVFPLILPSASL